VKISSYFIVTEPDKMGFPYLECVKAALSFCDEAVVVCGRKEQSSEDKLLKLSKNVKVINTYGWPVKWNYDHMRDHLQIGLNNCTGDFCLKIDADCVFRNERAKDYRDLFEENKDIHRIDFGRVNFFCKNIFFFNRKNHDIFALNKTLLKKDGIDYFIGNRNPDGSINSTQPEFSKDITTIQVSDGGLWPINYDNTFMDKEQVIVKWINWHKAIGNDEQSRNDWEAAYTSYMDKKRTKSKAEANYLHPEVMTERIKNLKPEHWGYNNFGAV